LKRRHNPSRGTLVVLDVVQESRAPHPAQAKVRTKGVPIFQFNKQRSKMMKPLTTATIGLFAIHCWASAIQAPEIPQPTIPERTFKITDYGAVPDARTLNTAAVTKAISACQAAGGGKVVVPPGEFLSGPLEFVSGMALHLEKGAVLRFSDDFALYDKEDATKKADRKTDDDDDDGGSKAKAPIIGRDLTDIAITGEGTIDGNGRAWWAHSGKKAKFFGGDSKQPARSRPDMIQFIHCKRVLLEGVTICNAPQFHIVPHYCDGVTCRGLKIIAPENSPNTDGIDPSNSRNVLITRCLIDNGDDNISFKSRRDGDKITSPTENVYVTDCTFLHGHGVSVGSRVWPGIRNIVVDHCTFDGTHIGIRVKSARGRGGVMENITYSNIKMKNVGTALTINMYYFDRNEGAQPVTAETPIVRNIRVQNVSVSGAQTAGDITGLPEMPVSDIVLKNVDISAETGMRIQDAKDVQLENVKIKAATGKALTIANALVKGAEGFGDTTPDASEKKKKK
jgi:polygalacturonase